MTFPSLASATASSSWASFATTFLISDFKVLHILPSTAAVAAEMGKDSNFYTGYLHVLLPSTTIY